MPIVDTPVAEEAVVNLQATAEISSPPSTKEVAASCEEASALEGPGDEHEVVKDVEELMDAGVDPKKKEDDQVVTPQVSYQG